MKYKVIEVAHHNRDFQRLPNLLYSTNDAYLVSREMPCDLILSNLLVMQRDIPKARLTIFKNDLTKPQTFGEETIAPEQIAFFGNYECIDDTTISALLLEKAIEKCHKMGIKKIIGPMNGSTWYNYRFTVMEDEKPFFSEPYQKPYYIEQWKNSGFEQLNEYCSYLAEIPSIDPAQFQKYEMGLSHHGIELVAIDFKKFDATLEKLHTFIHESFKTNFLYSPIDKTIFIKKYKNIRPFLSEDFTWFAMEGDKIVGFIMAFPDYLNKEKNRLVVKTFGRLPDEKYKSLGRILAAKVSLVAKEKGFTHYIQALMRADNASVKRAAEFQGKPFKSYHLFSMTLQKNINYAK